MTKAKTRIRKAIEKDYEKINALYYETYSFYHENLSGYYKKMPKQTLPRGTFLNMIEDKNALFIVSEIKNQVTGILYAEIEKEEGDNWIYPYRRVLVEELSVSSLHRNLGIGSLLMKEAENWAKENKITDLTVLVYAFNQTAVAFYEKNGYRPYSIKMDKKI